MDGYFYHRLFRFEVHVAVDMSDIYIYINIFLRLFTFLVVNFVHFMAKK
jgi:hypothetical protein